MPTRSTSICWWVLDREAPCSYPYLYDLVIKLSLHPVTHRMIPFNLEASFQLGGWLFCLTLVNSNSRAASISFAGGKSSC